jgi:hypothetical protein
MPVSLSDGIQEEYTKFDKKQNRWLESDAVRIPARPKNRQFWLFLGEIVDTAAKAAIPLYRLHLQRQEMGEEKIGRREKEIRCRGIARKE